MKDNKKINVHPHDPAPPNYGGHDQPIDYSDAPRADQSILPMGESTDKPPVDFS
ncbi:MAG: hypothetical protein R3Y62_06560 [Eubacteriales bacterium]